MNRLANKPTGRVSLKGKARIEKKYAYNTYKIEFKMAVLEYWEQTTLEMTLTKFWSEMTPKELDTKRKLLYAWRKNKGALKQPSQLLTLCKIRPTGLACSLPSDVERYLANLIRSYRSEGIPI